MEKKNKRKRKEPWTREEEDKLRIYVLEHGPGEWDTVSRFLNIGKSGNSCRLKWVNYLDPNIVRGKFTDKEMLKILKLRCDGNGWSKIAEELPGRTDNEIKNFCNSKRMKKEAERLNWDVTTHEFLRKMTSSRLTGKIPLTEEAAAEEEEEVIPGDIVADCTYQELMMSSDISDQKKMMSSDIIDGPNADQDCGTCDHGEAIRAFVDDVLDGRIILPELDHDCRFDIHNYYHIGREF